MYITAIASVIGAASGIKMLTSDNSGGSASQSATNTADAQAQLARDAYTRGVGISNDLIPLAKDTITKYGALADNLSGLATTATKIGNQNYTDYMSYGRPAQASLAELAYNPDIYKDVTRDTSVAGKTFDPTKVGAPTGYKAWTPGSTDYTKIGADAGSAASTSGGMGSSDQYSDAQLYGVSDPAGVKARAVQALKDAGLPSDDASVRRAAIAQMQLHNATFPGGYDNQSDNAQIQDGIFNYAKAQGAQATGADGAQHASRTAASDAQTKAVYQNTYGRDPTEAELQLGTDYLGAGHTATEGAMWLANKTPEGMSVDAVRKAFKDKLGYEPSQEDLRYWTNRITSAWGDQGKVDQVWQDARQYIDKQQQGRTSEFNKGNDAIISAENTRRAQVRGLAEAEAGRAASDAYQGQRIATDAIQREMQRKGMGNIADPRYAGAMAGALAGAQKSRIAGMNLARGAAIDKSTGLLVAAAGQGTQQQNNAATAANTAGNTAGTSAGLTTNTLNNVNIANAPANAGTGAAISAYGSAGGLYSGVSGQQLAAQGAANQGFGQMTGTAAGLYLGSKGPWWTQSGGRIGAANNSLWGASDLTPLEIMSTGNSVTT